MASTSRPPGQTAQFSSEQWSAIQLLAGTLTPEQVVWVTGYLAGVVDARRAAEPAPAGATVPAYAPTPAPAAATKRGLTILYGTETGNATDVARQVEARAKRLGLPVALLDMAGYKARRLKDERDLIVITSTHGEGDPPEPAADFFEFVLGSKAPPLPSLRYAVLGLGDSTYEKFCEAARQLDGRFEALGGERLLHRVDCDVDYENVIPGWIDEVFATLTACAPAATSAGTVGSPGLIEAAAPLLNTGSAAGHARAGQEPAYGKRHPFPATVLENLVLTGRGSSKETRHIEVSLAGSGLSYQPGDALGIRPRNDPVLVEALLEAAGLDPQAPAALKGEAANVLEALQGHFEVTALTPRFVAHWGELSGAPALRMLLDDTRKTELAELMRRNQILDLVRDYPVKGLRADDFLAGLRGLQPRLYSIASDTSAAPDEAHLTVSAVRYEVDGRPRAGVSSVFLAERTQAGDTLPVFIQSNPHFRLPDDDERPVIMIGAGTGIAPYRAFMQAREAQDLHRGAWLFFGERQFRTDFLYQVEWQALLRERVLTRLDVAFSRDQPEKIYVHHRMREQARDFYAWLEDGAHVYVCGDATSLAPDVHTALVDIVRQQKHVSREGAEEYVRALQRDGRYQRDVY